MAHSATDYLSFLPPSPLTSPHSDSWCLRCVQYLRVPCLPVLIASPATGQMPLYLSSHTHDNFCAVFHAAPGFKVLIICMLCLFSKAYTVIYFTTFSASVCTQGQRPWLVHFLLLTLGALWKFNVKWTELY